MKSATTKEVIVLSRWEAAKLYEKELTKLIRGLSMEKCSNKILKKTGKTYEPYRVFLRPLRDKIRKTHRLIERHLVAKKPLNQKKLLSSKEEILKPLRVVRESLEQNQSENIASGELLDLMRRAKCFGINLAKIDIRQESSRHSKLLAEYLKKNHIFHYLKWDEDKKIKYLSNLMKKNNRSFKNFNFKVPHKSMKSRNFVLYPLHEIDPHWKHPETKEDINNLMEKLDLNHKKSILKMKKS